MCIQRGQTNHIGSGEVTMIYVMILIAFIILILFLKRRQPSNVAQNPKSEETALDVARDYISSIALEEPDDEEPWPDQEDWDDSMQPDFREAAFAWSLLVHAAADKNLRTEDLSDTGSSTNFDAEEEIVSLGTIFLTRVIHEEERSGSQDLSTSCMGFLSKIREADWLLERLEPKYNEIKKNTDPKADSLKTILSRQPKVTKQNSKVNVKNENLTKAQSLVSKTNSKTVNKLLAAIPKGSDKSARITITAQIKAAYRTNLSNRWGRTYLVENGTPILSKDLELPLERLSSIVDFSEILEDYLTEDGQTCEDRYTPYLPFMYGSHFSTNFFYNGNKLEVLHEPSYEWWEAYCLDFSYETLLISINYDGIEIAFDANGSEFESFKTKLRESQE